MTEPDDLVSAEGRKIGVSRHGNYNLRNSLGKELRDNYASGSAWGRPPKKFSPTRRTIGTTVQPAGKTANVAA